MNRNAKIDEQLREHYQSAIYEIDHPQITLIPGKLSAELDVLLIDNNVYSASLLTAHNPRSKQLSNEEHDLNQLALLNIIKGKNVGIILGRSKDPMAKWPEEAQILLLGMDLKEVLILAEQFNQAAILHHSLNQPTELLWL